MAHWVFTWVFDWMRNLFRQLPLSSIADSMRPFARLLTLSRQVLPLADRDRDVAGLPSVTAKLNFGQGTHTARKDGDAEVDAASSLVPVSIYDGRADPPRFSLDSQGFSLVEVGDVPLNEDGGHLDLYDLDVAINVFFPRVEEFLRKQLGATRVIAFDHILRNPERLAQEQARLAEYEAAKEMMAKELCQKSVSKEECGELKDWTICNEKPSAELSENATCTDTPIGKPLSAPKVTKFLQGTLANVHGDYTARSGRSRAEQLLSPYISQEELERALSSRFQIINLWHPFAVVEKDPLALCTWRSISPHDVLTNRMTFKHRVGETYKASPSPDQRWVYFSGVKPDEAVLLKPFDSLDDGHTSRFCLHSAFELPDQSERQLPVRESIEVRCLVLYGDGLEDVAPDFVAPHVDKKASTANELNGQSLLSKETLSFGDSW